MHPTMFLTMHIYKALHICSVRDYYKCPKLHYNTVFYGYFSFPHRQIALHMQSPDGNHLWCPGPSLWNLIADHVHASELPKIRTALGHSRVDMYIEVHSEVSFSDLYFFYLNVATVHTTLGFPDGAFIFRCFIIHAFHSLLFYSFRKLRLWVCF